MPLLPMESLSMLLDIFLKDTRLSHAYAIKPRVTLNELSSLGAEASDVTEVKHNHITGLPLSLGEATPTALWALPWALPRQRAYGPHEPARWPYWPLVAKVAVYIPATGSKPADASDIASSALAFFAGCCSASFCSASRFCALRVSCATA